MTLPPEACQELDCPIDTGAILAYFGEGRLMTIPISLDWAFQSDPVFGAAAPHELPPPLPRMPLNDPSQPVAYQPEWGNIVKAMYRFGGRVTYGRGEAGESLATLELPPLWG